ncbi:succinylglutamate desuccinylase [Halomonas janggokensis]|uniref:Succinylglutamate desuccinylase n=1 Tax=Vreelandella janggokensis TaxID=370767 RepID=A0ABT4IQJ8_9GAMM|nr:succinylglutamate desuccinylase [Halomonas janggokensis]MCZ0925833.1 succinylglutamate desuccinylase [Halomonas janggokensis]MCZ0930900.1 succinylglutamate desuccinylase [Halomonas janggokensis]
MLGEWLDWTLDEQRDTPRQGTFASGRFDISAPGVMRLTPHRQRPDAHACIFSAAIHGNETAPVELLGAWLSELEAGTLTLGAPVLVILGNIPALKAQQRFIHTNLNRLFERGLSASGDEPDRARQLMAEVDDFFSDNAALPKLHYDLHTAIRASLYPRFVVEPYGDSDTHSEQWQWLAAADMQAVLHQHQHIWTFSHYSKHYHGAQSFTFELGRVAPFGQNDMASLTPMQALLGRLSEGTTPAESDIEAVTFFRVRHELMRHGDHFTLCFDDDTPNFTHFAPGTCLANDSQTGEYRVGDTPLHVVFPNANVEIGARAALLVVPCAPPTNA